ncbi:MAG: DUF3006 domain-containing protein [Oscillospiraceae bacterium]
MKDGEYRVDRFEGGFALLEGEGGASPSEPESGDGIKDGKYRIDRFEGDFALLEGEGGASPTEAESGDGIKDGEYRVDRFEGDFALLEGEGGETIRFPKEELPEGVPEGAALRIENGAAVFDEERTAALRKRLFALAKRLRERK